MQVTKLPTTFFVFLRVPLTHLGRWFAFTIKIPRDYICSLTNPNIEKTREEYFAKKKAEEERALKEKAKSYYEDEWVMAKEKELQDLQRKQDAATDPDTKRALAYVMGVAVDALRGRFQREDVPGLKKHVLLERRRVATELGWCSRDQAATIQSHSPFTNYSPAL